MTTCTRITLFSFLFLLFIPHFASAESKTFIKEYTYQASEDDSKSSSRTLALRQVKRILLEELGTYLESETEVKEFKLTKDQITTLTAGIVQTEIIEESWDGEKYWLNAKITADSAEVIKAIDKLHNNRKLVKELEELRKQSDKLLKENEKLRKERKTAKSEKQNKKAEAYRKNVSELSAIEWVEKGWVLFWERKVNEAIYANDKAIEINPKSIEAYKQRAFIYGPYLRDYNQAIKDYDKAITLNPKDAEAYAIRGEAFTNIRKYSHALSDFNTAIRLAPKYASAYNGRGNAYYELHNYNLAIKDYTKAIEIMPVYLFFQNRGIAYAVNGNFKEAIQDYTRAIDLYLDFTKTPDKETLSEYYYKRGLCYAKIENFSSAINDLKIAAQLGDKRAQSFLKGENIEWQ